MSDKKHGIQSIEIGFRILRCLEVPKSLTLGEIARETHLAASKVRFYLISFTNIGFVAQDTETGRYGLGPSALRLGLSAIAHMDILTISRKAMRALAERTEKTVFVSVWGTHGPTVVDRHEVGSVSPLAVQIGAVMPLVSSATGRVFLAYLPFSSTQDLVTKEMAASNHEALPSRRFSWTKVNRLVLDVKEHGISYIQQPSNIRAIAAPIFDHLGNLKCVMTLLVGYEGGSKPDYDMPITRELCEATSGISRELRELEGEK